MESEISRPRVVLIMYVWCVVMTLLYLGLSALLYVIFMGQVDELRDLPPVVQLLRWGLLCFVLVLAAAYASMLVLPRCKPVWIYGIVLLGLSSTSLITAPFAVPILVYWLKPIVREYFHVGSSGTVAPVATGA